MNLMRKREKSLTSNNPLAMMRDEMERVFDRWFDRPLDLGWATNSESWAPAIDVIDGETEVTIKAEVPGMAARDVNVSISGNMLTLSGQKEEREEEKGEGFTISERRFGSFRRSIELPAGIDADKVMAEQDNGVLTIKVPKLKTAKPKQIPIKAART